MIILKLNITQYGFALDINEWYICKNQEEVVEIIKKSSEEHSKHNPPNDGYPHKYGNRKINSRCYRQKDILLMQFEELRGMRVETFLQIINYK